MANLLRNNDSEVLQNKANLPAQIPSTFYSFQTQNAGAKKLKELVIQCL